MKPSQLKKLDCELRDYVAYLTDDMGRPERRGAMGVTVQVPAYPAYLR
ncbi:MAG: hypothetical protein AAB426_14760 [Myxococcota bacterium]